MLIFLLLAACFQSSFKLSAFISKCVQLYLISLVRESSFNMTRRGDEDIEGGFQKFLDTRKGGSEKLLGLERGSENLYTTKPIGGGEGGLLKIQPLARGLLKFQASSFNIFIPIPCHIK